MRHKTILASAIPMLMSIIGCTVAPNETETAISSTHGWIDSPLVGERRDLGAESIPGVSWFLGHLEPYTDAGFEPVGAAVADITHEGAIRLRIYGETIELSDTGLASMNRRLEEKPHTYRVDANSKSITYCNQVLIEKIKPTPLFEEVQVGESLTVKLGNMPCDLILDALTVPFALDDEGTPSPGVDPRVLLPYLGEQYGAGLLSKVVSWRLVDRAMGWPAGEEGEKAALEVADVLRQQCLLSPQHLQHGWCLRDLRKLAKNATSPRIDEILEAVEAKVAEKNAHSM